MLLIKVALYVRKGNFFRPCEAAKGYLADKVYEDQNGFLIKDQFIAVTQSVRFSYFNLIGVVSS